MRKRHLILPLGAALIGAGTMLWKPGKAQTPPSLKPTVNTETARAQTTPLTQIAHANNRFGFRLFAEVSKQDTGRNICVSPISLALALEMTYNGAGGTTQKAMQKTLELEGMNLDEVNAASHALLQSLTQPPPVATGKEKTGTAHAGKTATHAQLDIANSLWLDRKDEVDADFIQRAQQSYRAEVGSLKGAPDTINAWVRQHTNSKIDNIVTARDVVNALCRAGECRVLQRAVDDAV